MIVPIEVRRAAGEYGGGDARVIRAFVDGWVFAHPEYSDNNMAQDSPLTMEKVIEKWVAYKKERRQTYKPRGLESMTKRLMQMSGGDPYVADVIVEHSMSNNYQGLYPPKNNSAYGQQSNIINKVADILAD